jgi:hypothetical protein
MGRKGEKTRIKEMETLVQDFKATFAELAQDNSGLKANREMDAKFEAENKKKHGS